MEAAIARARMEVDSFIAELAKPSGDSHAVKVPITDQGDTEHFWLIDVTYSEGEFAGTINNEPGIVSNVRIGDERKVNKSEIFDWMFMRGGKMYGNYTLRPLLKAMPKDEARSIGRCLPIREVPDGRAKRHGAQAEVKSPIEWGSGSGCCDVPQHECRG